MSPHKHYLDDAQRKWVRSWWLALQPREDKSAVPGALALLGRGDRAGLKRCSGVAELLTESATFQLAERLLSLEAAKERARFADDHDAVALVAGVLSHVSQDRASGKSLIAGLGRSGHRDATPKLSETRFQRLLQGRDLDDFYRQLVRVVQLAERTADVAQLADDTLAWCRERSHTTVTPSRSVRFRWARDYYLASAESAE
ncbi:type I-E CRISPR-associated protein Cse2/CasB (plasmid) [Ralstonia syzygii subsp. celebesensis]|uniref:Type I-E CRISPR-associated protein Cse2/CasB n=2 Tax=Ralstonia syzygii subsp. celebesensis TaxID=1310168 RepID=A0A1U9VMD8_9RALS|nr:type I-E CRISPR-associated protein Cse2/CasB [Ralstonia syzygii]AQW31868.1 type I-E CRISPR-associated protein Cse2/CasB [blood disease bacterium A2-HR MARDI]QQV57270.1 type I-E CRISPR-associated protein Cse2/CasB [Ralstonia syzygii subsp. celebesensis]CCA82576.1 putative CRISPR-associated protein Cse2 [blood disease bacterium R229]